MQKLGGVFAAGMLVIPIFVLLIAELGYWPSDAASEQPQWEIAIASRGLQASIERQAPQIKSPVPADTPTILAGMKIYRDDCAGCHGLARRKALYRLAAYPRVPQFGGRPPNLKDYQAYWVIKNGIRDSGMAGFHGTGVGDGNVVRRGIRESFAQRVSGRSERVEKPENAVEAFDVTGHACRQSATLTGLEVLTSRGPAWRPHSCGTWSD
jgi:mono/diheme cytochrome c family protein